MNGCLFYRGIKVLGQKSELQKAMEKMRKQVSTKQQDEERKLNRSDLELKLEKRQLRLKEYENMALASSEQPQPIPVTNAAANGGAAMAGFPSSENVTDEFHRMHAKVNGRFASATTS